MISLFSRKVALAIGESLESVCSMQEKERKELMEVLGFKVMNIPRDMSGEKTFVWSSALAHHHALKQSRNTAIKVLN